MRQSKTHEIMLLIMIMITGFWGISYGAEGEKADSKNVPDHSAPVARNICYIAHRGEAFDAPEGTRPAYQLTMERHLPGVKLDLQYSRDNIVVMSHDSNLKRMTGRDFPIRQTNYSDLKKAVFKTVGGYAGERILTFEEALTIVKDCPLLFIDFKFYSDEMAKNVFQQLKSFKISSEKIMAANFSEKTLTKIKKSHPEIRTVLHVSYSEKNGKYEIFGKKYASKAELAEAILSRKKKLDLFGVNINANQKIADQELIKTLHRGGLWVSIWFVNKPEQAKFFHAAGADAFVTDCGEKMRNVVEKSTK